ncbi:DUF5677 domain-containing protein [Ralstonia pickettii]|uniref:Uncharacterized protein n=1 Tax=Ralstonia pickettii TaxID=329 RepID=A0AAW4Q7T9_RALPI|nr:DUF5677 domain-containing protein [Ralstonia pickettii]MBA9846787.1 hypothetical protein [Ralstonia pickettii]MBA9852061.1 hypothetical protein [Ralstonia pickettii]MBA9919924.1 hypothetical protein [Ralstonia pickettii]MBA9959026.1 hypothetical protein [Ralstonia pickettii]MBA9964595.1 hypothetical protein [Ralstonia pickettii]
MSEIQQRGFLSSELDEQKRLARSHFAAQFQTCESWSERAVGMLNQLRLDGKAAAFLFAAGFWIRCVRSCQGGILLAEMGMVPDALTLARSAVESLFHAVALVKKPELLPRLVEQDQLEQVKQANGMLAIPTITAHLTPEGRQEIQAMIDAKPEKLRSFGAYDAAREAGLLELYETMYRGFSRSGAHSTLFALNHEFVEEADGSITPNFGPCYDEVPWVLEMLGECMKIGLSQLSVELT